MKKTLRNLFFKSIFGFELKNYFFASGGEDAILQMIFQEKLSRGEKGFYVDVGAFHPYDGSNTYLFYRNGWNGINIDAQAGTMKAFNKQRPRDFNIEIGIAEHAGTIPFHTVGVGHSMNSFSEKFLNDNGIHNYFTVQKQVKPLRDIIEDVMIVKGECEIDFLNIDVEGFDLQVVKSNDWNIYRPRIVVIEMDCSNITDVNENPTAIFMKDQGYEIIAKNVILPKLASVFFQDRNKS